ncbi:MAG TPA: diacylglycerol kinase family protein [Chloroflexota bacterium]
MVNPAAGGGRAIRAWRAAARGLAAQDYAVTVYTTTARGEGADFARQAVDRGYTTVVAVGGDGTIHEVVNGLSADGALRDDVRLAVVPAGTGMDFRRNLGLRRGVQAAVARLLRGEERRVDVGLITAGEPRLFVNFAEVGMGASVVARETRFSTLWPGRASFFLAGIAAAARERPMYGVLQVDGRTVYAGRLVSLVIANGSYFAGGIKIAPPARVDDGELDIVLLGDLTRIELVSQFWKVYPGTHLRNPQVHWMRGREVSFESTASAYIDLDGELYAGEPGRIIILREALRVVV